MPFSKDLCLTNKREKKEDKENMENSPEQKKNRRKTAARKWKEDHKKKNKKGTDTQRNGILKRKSKQTNGEKYLVGKTTEVKSDLSH